MNIAVDAFPLTARAPSGIPNYLRNILFHLLRLDKEDAYFLYCKNPFEFAGEENPTLKFSRSAKETSTSYGNTIWLFTKGIRLMNSDGIDLLWGPRHMLPPLLPGKIKTVLTVHDLVWRYFPETMERYNLLVMKLLAERSIKAADHIIAVSNSTAQAIMDFFGVRREKISVIYNGTDRYIPLDKDESAEYISEGYKTNRDYVLTVSTVEPRKNLKTLLRAFSKLKPEGPQLLVAGASGWGTSSIHEEYERLGLTERNVKFLGYVPEENMNRLYSGAKLFVFPSLYEGFGIPPLEAMASGTPVIASNSSSIPEVVGDVGLLLNPHIAGEWTEAIGRALSDASLLEEMRNKGIERAAFFSWEEAARKTLEVFRRFG